MPLAVWAKTAAGTNFPFVKGFGKIIKNWRESLQQAVQRKVLKVVSKPKVQKLEVGYLDLVASENCSVTPTCLNRKATTIQSRIFQSLLSRTFSKSLASELRRRSALLLSSSSGRNIRNVPLMSLIGLTLGVDISTVVDDNAEKLISEMRDKFRNYTYEVEPLQKVPQSLSDLDINLETIASGCEGAVYKARIKFDANDSAATNDSSNNAAETNAEYDLAIKAVFNYGAESNSYSIIRALEREIVPLHADGCQADSEMWNPIIRLPPHPNIVDMPGMFVDNMLVTEEGLQKFPAAMPQRLNPQLHYGRNKTLYLVMRRRSTHLRDYLASHDISMETRCIMLAQLLEGVSHMASNGVAHRDLKTDNVLVDVRSGDVPHLEICDFGCCLAEENKSLKIPFPSRDMYMGGNSWLMAPELVTAVPGPENYLDYRSSDLWAAGAMAYEILGGQNPFYPGQSSCQQQLSSRNYREEDLPSLPEGVPAPIKRLVRSLLARDPRKRPSPCVAATVAQLLVLEGSGGHGQQIDLVNSIPRKQTASNRKLALLSAAVRKERQKMNLVMIHSLTLLCKLIFGDQSEGWDMKSVMSFLFLSRLNYRDFKDALRFL